MDHHPPPVGTILETGKQVTYTTNSFENITERQRGHSMWQVHRDRILVNAATGPIDSGKWPNIQIGGF